MDERTTDFEHVHTVLLVGVFRVRFFQALFLKPVLTDVYF